MDHKRIYLQAECCQDPSEGRLWCQDPIECDDSECPIGNPESSMYVSIEELKRLYGSVWKASQNRMATIGDALTIIALELQELGVDVDVLEAEQGA